MVEGFLFQEDGSLLLLWRHVGLSKLSSLRRLHQGQTSPMLYHRPAKLIVTSFWGHGWEHRTYRYVQTAVCYVSVACADSPALLRSKKKLGWAEPHLRFPLGFLMNFLYEIVLGHRKIKGVCLNLSKIQLEVAEMSFHFDCYVLFGYLSLMLQ